jgi:hypothetical protein
MRHRHGAAEGWKRSRAELSNAAKSAQRRWPFAICGRHGNAARPVFFRELPIPDAVIVGMADDTVIPLLVGS